MHSDRESHSFHAGVAAIAAREPEDGLLTYRFTPIATDTAYEGSPAWSPDGATIAFIRDVSGVLQIFTRSSREAMARRSRRRRATAASHSGRPMERACTTSRRRVKRRACGP